MDRKPSVLFFSSCNDVLPAETIKLVIENELPEAIDIDEDIKAYPWHIENKYYTTDVYLCSVGKKTISNKEFADSVEAVILYFDSSSERGLELADSWLPFIKEFDPEIKILLCKNCDAEKHCTLREAQEWCIGRGFELIELDPVKVEDEEVEDDFPETTGLQRIRQALNAHIWPNLVMKTASSKLKKESSDIDKSLQDFASGSSSHKLEESLEELLDVGDDFSELFSRLPDMKARVTSLSGADRKAAAEQVVMAYWKAIGGDEEEFEDI